MINVLFVCTGDTCRSTMASALLKDAIKTKNIKNLRCSSAGLFVVQPASMNKTAKIVLRKMGVVVPRHKSTQLTLELLCKYNYCLTMTTEQKFTILNKFPKLTNVKCISEVLGVDEIDDPYGKPEEVYYNVARSLAIAVDNLIKIINEKGELW